MISLAADVWLCQSACMNFAAPLPIDEVLPSLKEALAVHSRAVLVAPPGAGKTTRVPLALLEQPFVGGGRIIVLEPRRLAARAAAQRMAETLGDKVGGVVGLRVRLESRVSSRTRIEVVTEGVFARMILDDPSLEGVSAVLFDEFHERSLDADMGLALALDAQAGLREDLRILVMSATLDGARVRALLGDALLIESEGRAYPVETRYLGRNAGEDPAEAVARAILRALDEEPGSVLAFLPGQGEILRCAERLRERVRNPSVDIAPLFGAMDRADQDRAVEASPKGRRKVVLATSIAETSLTIEGVRVVVDSGLSREPRYEPDIGLTRLETVRASRAAADQRRGRAGRTEPGVCYRLWEEAAKGSLAAYSQPEILSADLSSLLLDLAAWGARDPSSLLWLDPPPAPAIAEARALLNRLGALDAHGAITDEGRAIRALSVPPRLARMVVDASRHGAAGLAADIAAVIVERGLGGNEIDLAERVRRFRRERSQRADAARRMARNWAQQAGSGTSAAQADAHVESAGALIALAWPDRIAKARGAPGEFLMANGRAASVEAHNALAREPFLAIAEIAGRASAARILAAAAMSLEEVEQAAGPDIWSSEELIFDRASASVKAAKVRKLGAITLARQPLPATSPEAARVLAEGIASLGVERLPWTKAQKQWRDRVMFLRNAHAGDDNLWPDVSDAALVQTAANWLAPFIEGRSSLAAISADDLGKALSALLPWDLQRRLDVEAPTHFEAPTGSHVAVDYESDGAPVIAIRVQELYGLAQHPALAGGRAPLTLHLLSPAHRPIQITKDLPGFWRGSWASVKTEMKGRYPRHLWPDDPAAASPTTRAKPRGT
jgi:ATP-dependent helicase HrpB